MIICNRVDQCREFLKEEWYDYHEIIEDYKAKNLKRTIIIEAKKENQRVAILMATEDPKHKAEALIFHLGFMNSQDVNQSAASILTFSESCLLELNYQKVKLVRELDLKSKSIKILNKIFKNANWKEPISHGTFFRIFGYAIRSEPWYKLKMPEGIELKSWRKLNEDDRKEIKGIQKI